ncbi:MAG: hypothetical protein K1X79_00610 [Oligoflexia bacterium]|nr:hypothetical protein [Oligoflexia bacterium]
MKNLILRLTLALLSLIFSLVAADLLTGIVMPISPGARLLNQAGQEETLFSEPGVIRPNLQLRQVSSEFDAMVSTTQLGYRGPDAGLKPETVFIGDSFTFGTGLSDQQTISAIYCDGHPGSCANLGLPGSGTALQVGALRRFLDQHGWRPREVIFLPMMMTARLFAGNDLEDNVNYAREHLHPKANVREVEQQAGPICSWNTVQHWLIAHSNLMRLIKFRFGPLLRSKMSRDFAGARLEEALSETAIQLEKLRHLACQYGFNLRVLLLHPMQALINKQDGPTLMTLRERFGWLEIEDSAQLFTPDPASFYYSFDGHFKPAASAAIAGYLKTQTPKYASLSCQGEH